MSPEITPDHDHAGGEKSVVSDVPTRSKMGSRRGRFISLATVASLVVVGASVAYFGGLSGRAADKCQSGPFKMVTGDQGLAASAVATACVTTTGRSSATLKVKAGMKVTGATGPGATSSVVKWQLMKKAGPKQMPVLASGTCSGPSWDKGKDKTFECSQARSGLEAGAAYALRAEFCWNPRSGGAEQCANAALVEWTQ